MVPITDTYNYVYDRFAQTRSLRIDAHDDDVNAVAFVDTATHILASGGKNNLKSEDYVHGFLDFFSSLQARRNDFKSTGNLLHRFNKTVRLTVLSWQQR